MNLFYSLDDLPSAFYAGAVTIGNFDGVHKGHARIIERLNDRAAEYGGPSVVFTFEPHPVRLLRPEAAPAPLTWVSRKAQLLEALDVDIVIAYPTTLAFLSLNPTEYFQQVMCDRLQTRAIVEGPNFFFGKDRLGDTRLLGKLAEQNHIRLDIVEPLEHGDSYVSSSRVRASIACGDVDSANAMLTQPYRVRGMVTHGAGRGASLGYPTANVAAVDTLLPGLGVYEGVAHCGCDSWKAAVNIGPNPTFGEDRVKIEAHLIGFSGTLYGEPLELDFLRRLRDIQRFESPRLLREQLAKDIHDIGRNG